MFRRRRYTCQPAREPLLRPVARACCSLLRCKSSSSSSFKILSVKQHGMEFKSGGARTHTPTPAHNALNGTETACFGLPVSIKEE